MGKKLAIPSAVTPFFYRAARDRFQRWLGYRGTPLERAVILRDLIEAGLLTSSQGGRFTLADSLQSSSGHLSTDIGHATPAAGATVTILVDVCGFLASGQKPVSIISSFSYYWQDFSALYYELRRYNDADSSDGYHVIKQWSGLGSSPVYYYTAQAEERQGNMMVAIDEPLAGRWRYELYAIGQTSPTAGTYCTWDPLKRGNTQMVLSADLKSFNNLSGLNGVLGTVGKTYDVSLAGTQKYYFETETPQACSHLPGHSNQGGWFGVSTVRDTYLGTDWPSELGGAGYSLGFCNGNNNESPVPPRFTNCSGTFSPNQFAMHGWDGTTGFQGHGSPATTVTGNSAFGTHYCPAQACSNTNIAKCTAGLFHNAGHASPGADCCQHLGYTGTYSRVGVKLDLDSATLSWVHLNNGNYSCGTYTGIDTSQTWYPAVAVDYAHAVAESRFGEDGFWGTIPAGYSPFLGVTASNPHIGFHNACTFAIELG